MGASFPDTDTCAGGGVCHCSLSCQRGHHVRCRCGHRMGRFQQVQLDAFCWFVMMHLPSPLQSHSSVPLLCMKWGCAMNKLCIFGRVLRAMVRTSRRAFAWQSCLALMLRAVYVVCLFYLVWGFVQYRIGLIAHDGRCVAALKGIHGDYRHAVAFSCV